MTRQEAAEQVGYVATVNDALPIETYAESTVVRVRRRAHQALNSDAVATFDASSAGAEKGTAA